MVSEKQTWHRKSIRLQDYDYTSPGYYFITICTIQRFELFGRVSNGRMILNDAGEIVRSVWCEIPNHFAMVELDAFIVMPDHVHGILMNHDVVGARHAVPLPNTQIEPVIIPHEKFGKPVPGSIPTIIRSFKSEATRQINAINSTPGETVWQRNYYEHSIRKASDLEHIREYISTNPQAYHLGVIKSDQYQP